MLHLCFRLVTYVTDVTDYVTNVTYVTFMFQKAFLGRIGNVRN